MPQSAMDVSFDTEFIKCLIVGPPGTGKSVFASTFPKPGYVYDFSQGILIYGGMEWDYDQFQLSPAGYSEFEKAHMFVMNEFKKEVPKYQTIVVDDITAMESLTMEKALQLDPKRNEAGGPIWNVHYQLVTNLMEGKLRQIINLPCNIVLICHDDNIKDKEGAVVKVEPRLPGRLPTVISGYFDEMYYSTTRREAQGTRFMLQTVPIGLQRARSRLSGTRKLLPDFVDNNYPALIALLKKGQKSKQKGA